MVVVNVGRAGRVDLGKWLAKQWETFQLCSILVTGSRNRDLDEGPASLISEPQDHSHFMPSYIL